MKLRHRLLAPFFLLALTASSALALCGDVTGDTKVTSSDALRVLRKAVGQDVDMSCLNDPLQFTNWFGFANTLTCDSQEIWAEMTWSRHPALTWTDSSQAFPFLTPVYYQVDDTEVSGQIEMVFGDCDSVVFDMDSWGTYYPMPLSGGAYAYPYYDEVEDSYFLILELSGFDTMALVYGEMSPAGTVIAKAPGKAGLRNRVAR